MSIDIQGLVTPFSGPRKVWFTGLKNDETTALTGTSNGWLTVNSFLCFTFGGGKKARGVDVTKPETANLMLPAGVVIAIDNPLTGQVAVAGDGSGTTAGNLIPGWITIVSAAAAIQAFTKANMTLGVTGLAPANNSWALNAVTTSIASGAANLAYLATTVGLALETVDTSGLTEPGATGSNMVTKWIKLGGIVGGVEI